MSKRTVFTTVTPLPAGVTRQIVLDFLHDHEEMIDLNPLVKERHPIPTPPHALADEQDCQWFSLTDKISYFPGVAGNITYTCAFHDIADGVQTHCHAPAGLTIRDKWTVGGFLPGEPAQPVELGLKAPPTGLYLREDVDMRCNVVMSGFVKKTLKRSHAALVDRLKIKAQIASASPSRRSNRNSTDDTRLEPYKSATTEASGTGSIVSPYRHHLSASAPPRRPPSAASSLASAASSPSCYSAQSSPLWSPTTSSLTTTPALSVKSPPMTSSTGCANQPELQPGVSEKRSVAVPPTKFPSTIGEAVTIAAPVPEPETPFLRQHQPDWPLRTQPASTAPRPQSQLYMAAYRPPPEEPEIRTDSLLRAESNVSGNMSSGNTAPAGNNSNDALSDDALWHALGGGRFVANGISYQMNNRSHSRARSQGHPDYPQMSPYDDEDKAMTGLGVVRMRPVSQPPPLRLSHPPTPLVATLNGAFVARLD